MRIEDKIAVVLEELDLYDPQSLPQARSMKRAKKKIDKIIRGEQRREDELERDAMDAALDSYGDNV